MRVAMVKEEGKWECFDLVSAKWGGGAGGLAVYNRHPTGRSHDSTRKRGNCAQVNQKDSK